MARRVNLDYAAADIMQRRASGSTLQEIARDYRVHHSSILRLLSRQGFTSKKESSCQTFLGHPRPPQILDYPEQVALVNDKLVVVVADPLDWHVHAIEQRFNLPHRLAKRYFVQLKDTIEGCGHKMLFLWKDEISSPGLLAMMQHKTGVNRKICAARDCEVIRVEKDIANKFYDEHHVQGSSGQGIVYGLQFEGSLVSCMTFTYGSACRGDPEAALLQRFAAVGSVPGAASKLLKHFIRDNKPKKIISYSDERYAPGGGLYRSLGFLEKDVYDPDYRYFRDNRWYAKNTKQRKQLIRELQEKGMPPPTPTDTEFTMTDRLGYLRCYDCGKRSWLLEIPQ